MKCECCGMEIENLRCNNCGVVHNAEGIAQEPIRDYVISSVMEQQKGLNNLVDYLEENTITDKMVEIGAWLGASAIVFAKVFNEVSCVDHWCGDMNTPEVFEGCKYNFEKYKNINMIRKWSKDAAELFEDNSLDFVYIDGDHRPEFVKEDIELWWPKIKKGGIIAGHDYGRGIEEDFDFTGLTEVVDKFAQSINQEIITFCDSSWLLIKK